MEIAADGKTLITNLKAQKLVKKYWQTIYCIWQWMSHANWHKRSLECFVKPELAKSEKKPEPLPIPAIELCPESESNLLESHLLKLQRLILIT